MRIGVVYASCVLVAAIAASPALSTVRSVLFFLPSPLNPCGGGAGLVISNGENIGRASVDVPAGFVGDVEVREEGEASFDTGRAPAIAPPTRPHR